MSNPPIILGIESSCDETGCALVAGGRDVLSNVVATQIELHARFGGVVPELASRAHIEAVNTVVGQALAQSGVSPADVSAVAVTSEPGLIGSLLVGLMAAKTLAWLWDVPLIGVNHVYAHAYAAALNAEPIAYPAAALICSGGHTAVYRCAGPTELELLGTTIDDAAGEAFDKVATILRLSYPGGPAIDRAARTGNPAAVKFPRSVLGGQSLDFSFSGLKTAVLYHVQGVPGAKASRGSNLGGSRGAGVLPATQDAGKMPAPQAETSAPCSSEDTKKPSHLDGWASGPGQGASASAARPSGRRRGATRQRHDAQPNAGRGIEHFSPQEIADLAASFQAAVVDVLRIKLRRAARLIGARTLVLGGGVAANSALRQAATELADRLGCSLRMPELRFCLDNAAMVAGLAHHYLQAGRVSDLSLPATATVRR
jgi:N6-L-threonylcarbamoyladenine synthase